MADAAQDSGESRTEIAVPPASWAWRSLDAAALAWAIAVFVFGAVRASNEDRWSFWAYGDAQVLSAAIHFRDEGFLPHRLLPVFSPGHPYLHYTHYPSLNVVIAGVLAKVFADPMMPSRAAAVFAGSAGLLAWYLFARTFVGRGAAVLSAVYLGTAPVTLDFIDSLCNQSWDDFFRFAALWVFVAVEEAERPRRWGIALVALVLFLGASNSIEHIAGLELFVVGYCLIRGRLGRSWRRLALYTAAPFAAMALHFWQATLDYGAAATVTQWGFIVKSRILGRPEAGSASYVESLKNLGAYLFTFAWKNDRRAIASAALALAFAAVSGGLRNSRTTFIVKWGALLVVSLSSFYILLAPQSYSMRDYIPKHVLPAIALAAGAAGAFWFETLRRGFASGGRRWLRVAASGAGLFLAAGPVAGTVKYLKRYPHALDGPHWCLPHLTLEEWHERIEQSRWIGAHTRFGDTVAVPDTFNAISSMGIDPVFEYYAGRRLIPIGSTPQTLAGNVERFRAMHQFWRGHDAHFRAFVDRDVVPSRVEAYAEARAFDRVDRGGRFSLFDIDTTPRPPVRESPEALLGEARALWHLDGGPIAKDESGAFDAAFHGGAAARGVVGDARAFDGANAWIETPMSLKGWRGFTAAFWVRPEPRGAPGEAILLDNGHDSRRNFAIQCPRDGEPRWCFICSGTQAGFDLPYRRWSFVAVAADAQTAHVFVNGHEVAVAGLDGGLRLDDVPLAIGRWAVKPERYFKGRLDEVAVWDFPLDASDVEALAESYPAPPGD